MPRTAQLSTKLLIACCVTFALCGCGPKPPNNYLTVETAISKYISTNTYTQAPLGAQAVGGTWNSDINGQSTAPFGTAYSFEGSTHADSPSWDQASYSLGQWPASVGFANIRSPASWTVGWYHPSYCTNTPGMPYTAQVDMEPPANSEGMYYVFNCFTNTPANPNFIPANVNPQFSLDDATPASIQIATLAPIQAGPSVTNLHVYATNLANPSNPVATSIGVNGSSATFPFPRQANGSSLAAGAYITTITVDMPGVTQTTNGMEPFYIAHDDTSFQGAYGVAIASPRKEVDVEKWAVGEHNVCFPGDETDTVTGGTPIPLVTLLTQGKLAVGTSANLIPVGASPTVVIPFHDAPVSTTTHPPGCSAYTTTSYSGAQSALVVNTGSNTVSIVRIGQEVFPTGMVTVGSQPVAAAINAGETMAYIANYTSGTISEVNLTTLTQTRTLAVMTHPTSLAFDSAGTLWVGGQGSIKSINIGNWAVATTNSVDGTVNGLVYDQQQGALVQTLLQNGSASAPVSGSTGANSISFSASSNASYTTQGTFNTSTGVSTPSTATAIGDNSVYSQSSVASYLAYPGQLAFTPPIYSAVDGDITAVVTGNSFTVSVIATGQVLISGTLPHPPRGVALTNNMVYFTMPESNSLVSLPIALSQTQ